LTVIAERCNPPVAVVSWPATTTERRLAMAKGQMRSNKEKKKPKQDKNKKDKGGPAPSPFAPGQSQPGANPYGKK
jgi:hypothetical protein